MKIKSIEDGLIKSFVFLGPVGNLIPLWNEMSSFRFYFVLLPCAVLFFLCYAKRNQTALKRIVIFSPTVFYFTLSAFITAALLSHLNIGSENPVIRLFLFAALLTFSLFAGGRIEYYTEEENQKLIYLYLKGYAISLCAGYIMYIGYYTDLLSLEALRPFHILLQMGYGILRFSPGSYPNEYGIVSSFVLSIITFMIMKKKEWMNVCPRLLSGGYIWALYISVLIALFLTTTRAAYIAYIAALFYLIFLDMKLEKIIKRSLSIVSIGIILALVFQFYVYDIFTIIVMGYESFGEENASAYERFYAWNAAAEDFLNHYIWGIGFGVASDIHNTYLQMLFEVGIVGCLVIFLTVLMYIFFEKKQAQRKISPVLRVIRNIALMHVLWFGMSNHNLNHHMTWFCVILCHMNSMENERDNS